MLRVFASRCLSTRGARIGVCGGSTAAAQCCPQRRLFSSTVLLRAPDDVEEELREDIAGIIKTDRLVLFLTGTPDKPECRFTVRLVDLMNQLGLKYSFFNIMSDDEICEGLKVYSDWPTYPQVYIDGQLLGGYDICKDMMLDGSFAKMLKEKKLL